MRLQLENILSLWFIPANEILSLACFFWVEIESVGQYQVEELFLEAIKILSKKFSTLGSLIEQEEEVDADDEETLVWIF